MIILVVGEGGGFFDYLSLVARVFPLPTPIIARVPPLHKDCVCVCV